MAINQINQPNNRILTDQTESNSKVNNRTRKEDLVQSTSGTQITSADQVKLSPQAEIITRLANQLADLSAVRADRVEALKTQVESGTYKPDSKDIADAIIREEKL